MPRSVAVPEKTLEHWTSQHITYRYLTKASLWWPATGQDIDFRHLPGRSGKAVQLELKTITATGSHRYEVHVDLGQLWEYRQRPLGHQPFYAFPWPQPGWNGSLSSVAAAAGKPVTELGFSKRGTHLWFARWMVILTAGEVSMVMRSELNAHGSRARGKVATLVRFDHGHATWNQGIPAPSVVTWLGFWDVLEQCGRTGWPQLIRLPARLVSASDPHDRPQIMGLLRLAASQADSAEFTASQFVTLEPNADGAFQVAGSAADEPTGTDQDGTDEDDRNNEPSDHRLVAFLSANAIQGTSDLGRQALPSTPETDPFADWRQ
jgi:hypothetical protein